MYDALVTSARDAIRVTSIPSLARSLSVALSSERSSVAVDAEQHVLASMWGVMG